MKLVRNSAGLLLRLVAAAGVMLLAQQALAAGTAAGTTITNTATVNYNVGGVGQTAVQDSDAGFVVDNRVDMTLAESGNIGRTVTTPGQADNVTEFTLQNTGNQSQGYQLVPTALVGPDFQMTNPRVFVEDGTTPGYQSAEDTATVVDTLAADGSVVIYVVADTPGAAADTQTSDVTLQAITTAAGTGAAAPLAASGTPTASEDVVLAVGGVNGTGDATATDGYVVEVVTLVVTKTVVSTVDEFGNNYAIPGAIVTYSVDVQNPSLTTDATAVVLTDTLTEVLIEAPGSTVVTLTNATLGGVAAATCTADLTDTDGDGCGIDGTTSPQVLTLGNGTADFTIPANTTTTFQFETVIQ